MWLLIWHDSDYDVGNNGKTAIKPEVGRYGLYDIKVDRLPVVWYNHSFTEIEITEVGGGYVRLKASDRLGNVMPEGTVRADKVGYYRNTRYGSLRDGPTIVEEDVLNFILYDGDEPPEDIYAYFKSVKAREDLEKQENV